MSDKSDKLDLEKMMLEFVEDFETDCELNQMDLKEKLADLANISHKWLYRSYKNKVLLSDLKQKKKTLSDKLFDKYSHSDDARLKGLSQAALKRKIDNSEAIKSLSKDIEDLKLVIEYLEGVTADSKWILPKSCDNMIKLLDIESRT